MCVELTVKHPGINNTRSAPYISLCQVQVLCHWHRSQQFLHLALLSPEIQGHLNVIVPKIKFSSNYGSLFISSKRDS